MEDETLHISFSAEVNQNTTENLMGVVSQKANARITPHFRKAQVVGSRLT